MACDKEQRMHPKALMLSSYFYLTATAHEPPIEHNETQNLKHITRDSSQPNLPILEPLDASIPEGDYLFITGAFA